MMLLETTSAPHHNVPSFMRRLDELIKLGCRVDATDTTGRTLMHHICADFKRLGPGPIQLLASRSPVVTGTVDMQGFTPLALACTPVNQSAVSGGRGGDTIAASGRGGATAINHDVMKAAPEVKKHVIEAIRAKLQNSPLVPSLVVNAPDVTRSVIGIVSCLLNLRKQNPNGSRTSHGMNVSKGIYMMGMAHGLLPSYLPTYLPGGVGLLAQ